MLTLDEMVEIVSPHNKRILAEQRVEEREKEIDRLHSKINDLKCALGSCVALMKHDAEDKVISDVRREIIETGWRLSRYEA